MATDEEYLDSLLKSMTENEQQSRNMDDVIKSVNMGAEENDSFSVSPDDLADMLDMIGEKEEIQPVIEEIRDEVPHLDLGSVDVPIIQDTDDIISEKFMADDENSTQTDENQEEWKSDLEALLKSSEEEIATESESEDADLMGLLTSDHKEWDEVEETIPKEDYENMDVTELIDSLDEAQGDLLEINDLLKKADSNEYMEADNEDMLALLGSMQEEVSEEEFFWGSALQTSDEAGQTEQEDTSGDSKGKKKKRQKGEKKKLFGKKSKNADLEANTEEGASDENTELSEEGNKEKKPGRIASFFTYITQEVEEETDENTEILNVLEREDAQKAKEKKKAKKEKKKKESNKAGKGKNKDKSAKKAAKAEKKQLKEQKKQEKKNNTPVEKPKKVLSKKGKIVLVAFCASLVAAVFAISTFLPDYEDKNRAREAFYVGDYETVYKLLYGKQLGNSDRLIFERVETVLLLQRKLDSYQNNKTLERDVEALDALLMGVERYHELENVDELGVRAEADDIYNQICGILLNNYGLSEADVLEILSYDEFGYTRAVYNLIEGEGFSQEEAEIRQEEPQIPQDILPEEEGIISLNE